MFTPLQSGNILDSPKSLDYFEVVYDSMSGQPVIPETKNDTKNTVYSTEIPEEYHAALNHLSKHGSLTEQFLRNTLGNDGSAQRKARKFTERISDWEKYLPFNITIEQTSEGKEYRKNSRKETI